MIKNTFEMDFMIAEEFGVKAIEDTYNRAFKEWKGNYKYLTALVIDLNWRMWETDDSGNMAYAEVYDELWRKSDAYALNNLKGDELRYYLRETD